MKTLAVSLTETLYDEPTVSCILPTAVGEITILPHHRPLMSILSPGTAKITNIDGKVTELAITGGFLEVGPDGTVHILID